MVRMTKYLMPFILLFVVSSAYAMKQPENLYYAKQKVIAYHNSGSYERDMAKQYQLAKIYLDQALKQPHPHKKIAVVFDIDETLISNYPHMLENSFGRSEAIVVPYLLKADDPAIIPALKFYQYALKKKVAIFLVTGREEFLKAATVKNLNRVGYHHWTKMYVEKNHAHCKSASDFKAPIRKSIQQSGYEIAVNVGDQYSDLEGNHFEHAVKLPNPYYYIP